MCAAGDIVLVTPGERAYCTACMVVGASVYALVTSRLVGMLLLAQHQQPSLPSAAAAKGLADCDATLRELKIPLIFRSIVTDYLLVRAANDMRHRDLTALMEVCVRVM